ncbi:MAG: hypothetical protein NT075_21130 [Chloroflexi bacterium]|nr:hypothetical protein [Chloroflexota bacterium]
MLFALIFIDRRWWPKVEPTSTPVATVVRLPGSVHELAYLNSTKLGAQNALKVNLPAAWQLIDLDAEHLTLVLDKLKGAPVTPPMLEALETLLTAVNPDSTVLVALLLDEQATKQAVLPPNITIVVVPRQGLSLARYVEDVGADLRRRPGIEIVESKLDNTLRPTGLPVAILHYTLAAPLMADASLPMDGYQVAAFDAQATNIIVFTFTTPSPRYTELLPMFQELVRSAQFN